MYKYRNLSPEQKAKVIKQRLQKGYPSHSPPHPITNSSHYLITATCYEHKHRLNTSQRRQQLLDRLFETFIRENIEILAWVILTNHYHLLTTTVNFPWLSREIRLIHGRFARQWNQEDGVTGKFWYSYSDRAIRSETHYYRVINYIHFNPVKHKSVSSPYDWQESSVHWYLQEKGRDWLRNCWVKYPIKDYGQEWDISP
ncbi:MAG: transposase [Symploca sp. SIO1C2]|nr:transposase [Symploca sp. SIO1C2]